MSNRTISLSADLDRTNVASLAREAAELLASGVDAIQFDGAAVSRVRLCAVQMLASAVRTARAAGSALTLLNPSEELVSAVSLCGLNDLIFGSSED